MPRLTPGTRVASCVKFRPLRGRFSICFESISVEISDVLFSTSGAAAVTVIASCTLPTVSLKSTRATCPTVSTSGVTCILKPLNSAEILYSPTLSAVMV